MWVARKGFANWGPGWQAIGRVLAVLFCHTLIISTITGISFFQMWNVANITESYFGIPGVASSIVMAVLVAAVVIGGIRRLGAVAGWLVPFMILLYLAGGLVLLLLNVERLPDVFGSIFRSAFSPHEATGAFIGGTAGYAFLFGMKRALYSNEAGQGSSPIVHSAARTHEPVREGIVAGLEPFIDTIIVCTFSALVILASGVWNRAPDARFVSSPRVEESGVADRWTLMDGPAPALTEGHWSNGQRVYVIVRADPNRRTDNDLHRLHGTARLQPDGVAKIEWDDLASKVKPELAENGLWLDYVGCHAHRPRLRHSVGRFRQMAGDDRLLALRLLDDDLLDLLWRAGRRLSFRPTFRHGLPDHDLRAHGARRHPLRGDRDRGRCAHDAGHWRDAVGEHPAHDPAREPGDARLSRLHPPPRRRRLCGRARQVIESHSR